MRLRVEPWKDSCFTATLEGVYLLFTACEQELRLWVRPWKDCCLAATLEGVYLLFAACEPRLARCFNATLGGLCACSLN